MRRGDVFRLRIPRAIGHEQKGDRFAVVVQSDEHLPRSVVIVALTSRSAHPTAFRPEIEVEGQTTMVMVEQLAATDLSRLGELVGHVAPHEQWGIDRALGEVLGLR